MSFLSNYIESNLNIENLISSFDFSPSGFGNHFLDNEVNTGVYAKIYNYSPDFYSISGSGNFYNGRYCEISGYNDKFDNFTIFLTFERVTGKNCILLSTHDFTSGASGFTLGINDANRAYVHIEQSGINEIFTFDEIPLAKKNCLAFNFSNGCFNLNLCDLAYSRLTSQSYIFRQKANYQSNKLYFCSNPSYKSRYDTSDYVFNDFSGYFDHIALIKNALSKGTLLKLSRGLIPNYVSSGQTGDVVTGYIDNLLDYSMDGISLNRNYSGETPVNLVVDYAKYFNPSGLGIEPIFSRSLLGFKTISQNSGISLYISGEYVDPDLYDIIGTRISFKDNRIFDENTKALYDVLPVTFSESFTGNNRFYVSGNFLRKDICVFSDDIRLNDDQFVETCKFDFLYNKNRIYLNNLNQIYDGQNNYWENDLPSFEENFSLFSGDALLDFNNENLTPFI